MTTPVAMRRPRGARSTSAHPKPTLVVSLSNRMGKKGKKNAQPSAADDDDALLNAAIEEAKIQKSKMEAEAKAQAEQAAAAAEVQAAALGHAPLSHQEVIDRLDKVPTFHIVATRGKKMVPTNDGPNEGEACGCWYFDPEDARAQLEKLRAANTDGLPLGIETTPLGSAFALSEGWVDMPQDTSLRLQASHAVIASMPEPPEPLPEALRSRFNQLTGPIPVFCLDGFRVAAPDGGHRRPYFFDVPTFLAVWMRETGKRRDQLKEKLTVTDLRTVVAHMLATADDWGPAAFFATRESVEYAAGINVLQGDAPPALEEEEGPPALA